MFRYLSYLWPAQDLEAVCLTQNVAVPGALLLNGTYFDAPPTVSFRARGFARQVSLTSLNDLSGAQFTISGVQNTTLVTEVIAGPNNGTVSTTAYFDIISSISVDIAVNGISAGTGLEGAINLFSITTQTLNTIATIYPINSAFALSFNDRLTTGNNYKIYQSLTDLTDNGQTYLGLIANYSLFQKGSVSNLTQIIQSIDICYNILVQVSSISSTSEMEMQFLQL
jgi:hypothetical protein